MDLIRISTAMKVLERILDHLSELQDKDQDKLLELIRAGFRSYSLPTEMIDAGRIPEEIKGILKEITPEWICDAIANDDLSSWCSSIQRDLTLALAGQKLME